MPGKSDGDLVLCEVCVARSGGADRLIRALHLNRVRERNVGVTAEGAVQPTPHIVRIEGPRTLARRRIAKAAVVRISKMEIPLPFPGDSSAHSSLDLVRARSKLNATPIAHPADVTQRQVILGGSIVQRSVYRFPEPVGRISHRNAEISALKTARHLQTQSSRDFPSIG